MIHTVDLSKLYILWASRGCARGNYRHFWYPWVHPPFGIIMRPPWRLPPSLILQGHDSIHLIVTQIFEGIQFNDIPNFSPSSVPSDPAILILLASSKTQSSRPCFFINYNLNIPLALKPAATGIFCDDYSVVNETPSPPLLDRYVPVVHKIIPLISQYPPSHISLFQLTPLQKFRPMYNDSTVEEHVQDLLKYSDFSEVP